ncbi:MAG: type I CRISPR-associated protein Cas7 [Labilibaculum antarcticum]
MNFNNRVFGCAIVKAINSNYNADFSGQPRTLPDGTVYATDKAYKYTVKNFFKAVNTEDTIFYFKSLNENMNPISLDETYVKHFGNYPTDKKTIKHTVAGKLLSCLDIRLFGATFAGKNINISIHGPLQINHGINIWHENNIFSEQITSPFSNKSNDPEADRGMTTIGRQSKLQEGHYLHHFSINPANLSQIVELAGEDAKGVSSDDIFKLKAAMRQGATFYDSAAKAGTDNEILFWVQLKEVSKLVLPAFTDLVKALPEKQEDKTVFDFKKVSQLISTNSDEIECIELFINEQSAVAINLPDNCNTYPLFGTNGAES